MKKVSETPLLTLAPPQSTTDAPYWVALLRNLFGIFISHAQAINLLYENMEEDTEYLIPNRTFGGDPVYVQKFSSFVGPNGGGGWAQTSKAHGIGNMKTVGWFQIGGIIGQVGTFWYMAPNHTDPATGNINMVWVDGTNIYFRTNYNATLRWTRVILEYQKV